MKRRLMLTIGLIISPILFAGRAPFIDFGNVIHSEPIMKTIEVMVPVEECIPVATQVMFPAPNRLRYYIGPPIIVEQGTVVGSVTEIDTPVDQLVGAAEAGTREVVGLVKGLVIQDTIYPNPPAVVMAPPPAQVENQVICNTVSKPQKQKVFDGYKVTYIYNGQTFVIRTAERPGKQVKILVTTEATPIVQ
jgi:uncharacterized protein YcfJ